MRMCMAQAPDGKSTTISAGKVLEVQLLLDFSWLHACGFGVCRLFGSDGQTWLTWRPEL